MKTALALLALVAVRTLAAEEPPLPSPVVVTTIISTTTRAAAAPVGSLSVTLLKDRFIEAVEAPEKARALEQLALTAPTTSQDVAALFDMFTRFPNTEVRATVMRSLALLKPGRPDLEGQFIAYLKQPETESQLFGINGAFRLRARSALPLVRAIASRRFAAASVDEGAALSERNAWWTQYEALTALAQWEGEKALPLLRSRAEESPAVGRILGTYFWKQTLPSLRAWSESADPKIRERATRAAAAQIEPLDARATRDEMMKIFLDKKADPELRHQLGLKIGLSSTDAEAAELVRRHDAETDESERLYWASAAALTRSPKVVPLLVRYAAKSPDEVMRKGATAQLIDMLGEDQTQRLIDAENAPTK